MSYTTIDLIEAELNLTSGTLTASSTPSSTDVTSWITEAESIINLQTGNVYSSTLESSVVFDWENNGDYILRVDPFISITSLEYSEEAAGDTPVWVAKTEDTDFYAYEEEGEIEFITGNFTPIAGKRRFRLTYTTGTSSVPANVQRAATMMVANRLVGAVTANQAYEQSGGSVQVGTIKIDDPSAFSLNAYRAREEMTRQFIKDSVGTFKAYRIARAYD
jgi:hypothetical protein